MVVTTKHEVLSHDSKTAIAHKLQPIPASTAVTIVSTYSNFYGRYYDVMWNDNLYSVNDNDIDIRLDESDWTTTVKCPYCECRKTVELPKRKLIVEDPWYDKYPKHLKVSDLVKVDEKLFVYCSNCLREYYIPQGGTHPCPTATPHRW